MFMCFLGYCTRHSCVQFTRYSIPLGKICTPEVVKMEADVYQEVFFTSE